MSDRKIKTIDLESLPFDCWSLLVIYDNCTYRFMTFLDYESAEEVYEEYYARWEKEQGDK